MMRSTECPTDQTFIPSLQTPIVNLLQRMPCNYVTDRFSILELGMYKFLDPA